MYVSRFPPIQLSHFVDSGISEPFLVTEWGEKMNIRVFLLDLHNCRVGKMIIMTVAYNNSINDWDIIDLARYVGEPFGTQEGKWRATRSEDRIKQDAKTAGEFDIVAGMA